MEKWKGRVAFITGASSGIGDGAARELVRHGVDVAACARDLDRLKVRREYGAVNMGEGCLCATPPPFSSIFYPPGRV